MENLYQKILDDLIEYISERISDYKKMDERCCDLGAAEDIVILAQIKALKKKYYDYFEVCVTKANAAKFRDDYAPYIISEEDKYFGSRTFKLTAPISIRDEIDGLKEESIEIIEQEPTSENLNESPLTDREISVLISSAHVRLNGIKGYFLSEEEDLENAIKKLKAMRE